MVPDTLDWDELRRGTRQEAACYALLTLAQKIISAGTIALTGAILAASGYVSSQGTEVAQPEPAVNAIRLMTGLLPAAILLCGVALSTIYPISRERHARIVRALEQKRARS
jgi:GPH family glycoside/pentoside/hexuronide:cation symporter